MDLNRDGDGFLVNTNDWSEEVMQQMAQEDDFVITDEFNEPLHYASQPVKITQNRLFDNGLNLDLSKLATNKELMLMNRLGQMTTS